MRHWEEHVPCFGLILCYSSAFGNDVLAYVQKICGFSPNGRVLHYMFNSIFVFDLDVKK